MNNHTGKRHTAWELWSKNIPAKESAKILDSNIKWVEQLYCEFNYHSKMENGHIKFNNDMQPRKNKDMFFYLNTNNHKVWEAYKAMINNRNTDEIYKQLI